MIIMGCDFCWCKFKKNHVLLAVLHRAQVENHLSGESLPLASVITLREHPSVLCSPAPMFVMVIETYMSRRLEEHTAPESRRCLKRIIAVEVELTEFWWSLKLELSHFSGRVSELQTGTGAREMTAACLRLKLHPSESMSTLILFLWGGKIVKGMSGWSILQFLHKCHMYPWE